MLTLVFHFAHILSNLKYYLVTDYVLSVISLNNTLSIADIDKVSITDIDKVQKVILISITGTYWTGKRAKTT